MKNDNRVDNLEWCTQSENITHAYRTGLGKKGEHHGGSKLTEKDVISIRNLYKSGNHSQKELGVEFGVSQNTVGVIVNYKGWKHI